MTKYLDNIDKSLPVVLSPTTDLAPVRQKSALTLPSSSSSRQVRKIGDTAVMRDAITTQTHAVVAWLNTRTDEQNLRISQSIHARGFLFGRYVRATTRVQTW